MTSSDPSPHRAPHLDSQVSYRLGVPLIYLKGELDHDSARQLEGIIKEEMASQPKALVLELSELTYMDSGGLSLIFDVVSKFGPPRWVGAVNPNAGVGRLLEMTGLTDRNDFKVFPDLQGASRALAGSGITPASLTESKDVAQETKA